MKGGNFLVTLIASPALGCTDNFTATKAVFIIPRPISKPIEKNNKLSQCLEGNYFQFDDQTTLAKIPKCAYTRTWYFTASDSATIPTPNKTYTTAGTYRILYKSETYYDNNRTGCTDTASLIINVIPDPSSGVSINNPIQCFKGNSFKFDNVYPGLSSWFWDLGDGTTTNTKSITHTYATTGNYQIIHEAQSPVGCKSRDTSYVYVKPITDAKFTGLSGAVCEGGAAISLTPGTPGGVFTTSSGTIAGTNYTPGNAGIQLVKYVIKDSFCPDSTTQTIKINALPKFSLGKDTTICDGSTTDLLIPVAGNVLWDDGSNSNPRTITNGGKYYAEVDNNGCKWSDTINISEKTTPQVSLPGDTLICKGSLLQLTASWPGATTTWSTGYTGNSIYVATSGIYTVTVTNACGFATDQIEVTLASGFCDVFIPDAFTPRERRIAVSIFKSVDCCWETMPVLTIVPPITEVALVVVSTFPLPLAAPLHVTPESVGFRRNLHKITSLVNAATSILTGKITLPVRPLTMRIAAVRRSPVVAETLAKLGNAE
jgi:hypothetical protein